MAIPTLSLRVILISTSVLLTAVILKLSVPIIMEFAFSEVVLSWLRPPYLYVVINCIIITIVASSKFHNNIVEDTPADTVFQPVPIKVSADCAVVYDGIDVKDASAEVRPEFSYSYDATADTFVQPAPTKVSADYAVVYDGIDVKDVDDASAEVRPEFAYGYDAIALKGSGFDVDKTVGGVVPEVENKTTTLALTAVQDVSGEDEVAVSTSLYSPQLNSTEYTVPSYEKPPVSVRIGHRKSVKSSPEGGKTLRVSKSKRHETLENTWKTITEGRSMPLARHLRKSDTWETHGRGSHLPGEQDKMVIKSETFNDRRTTATTNLTPLKLRRESSGSGKLKKEPSPSQDELNRRVEAFIKKINEEMRLQRQESLNQYIEMINRGAH